MQVQPDVGLGGLEGTVYCCMRQLSSRIQGLSPPKQLVYHGLQ